MTELFSDVELKMITCICQQKRTSEIAKQLQLSHKTVEDYQKKLLEKTKSKNSVGILIFAIKNDLYQL